MIGNHALGLVSQLDLVVQGQRASSSLDYFLLDLIESAEESAPHLKEVFEFDSVLILAKVFDRFQVLQYKP